MKARILVFATLIAALLVGGLAQAAFAGVDGMHIELHATAKFEGATGKAVYRDTGTEQEFVVKAENLQKLIGKNLHVFVNDTEVGVVEVDSLGKVQLVYKTYMGDTVPVVVVGDHIKLYKKDGTCVLKGQF